MPLIKSAKKRVRVASKASVRNAKTKRSLKGALKRFHKVLGGDSQQSVAAQRQAQSALDKAAKKGIIHKNKAARAKRKLAAKAKAAGVSQTKKVATKKPSTKKPAAKRTATTKSKK